MHLYDFTEPLKLIIAVLFVCHVLHLQDDEDTLSDVDVDQYIASEAEVGSIKQPLRPGEMISLVPKLFTWVAEPGINCTHMHAHC